MENENGYKAIQILRVEGEREGRLSPSPSAFIMLFCGLSIYPAEAGGRGGKGAAKL